MTFFWPLLSKFALSTTWIGREKDPLSKNVISNFEQEYLIEWEHCYTDISVIAHLIIPKHLYSYVVTSVVIWIWGSCSTLTLRLSIWWFLLMVYNLWFKTPTPTYFILELILNSASLKFTAFCWAPKKINNERRSV